MAYETLLTDLADGVLTVTLNRPERMNAYTAQLGAELSEAFQWADEDDAVRVVIVTGAGRAFCAGADVSDGADSFGGGGAKLFGTGISEKKRLKGGFTEAIFTCRKPSIAAINGGAVGVGITMTLPMDIRIASDKAKLGFVFARRGLTPEAGAAWFLPRLVGLPQALRWCYSGKVFDAAEALRGGLVSEVTTPEDLLPRAREIAREIVEETSPVSIALTRQLLWRMAGAAHPMEAHQADSRGIQTRGAMADAREGVMSFLEKRPPSFPNKVSSDLPNIWEQWSAPTFK